MIVVTISMQLGCGGRTVGQRVAEALGIPFLDKEIVSRAASLAGVSEEALADVDERRPTLLGYIADLLARYPTAAELGIPAVEVEPPLAQETFRRLFEDVILDVGTKGSAVIVGRGGQTLLRDKPWVVRVHVVAPMSARVARISEREDVSPEVAERMARESDRNRAGYIKTFYKIDWQDPVNYDLILNTGRLSMDAAVDLVLAAANALTNSD